MMPVTRPALRYFGGKWRVGAWIVSHFPEHVSYVEPFCGGASVLLQKKPVLIETINDLDGDLINFFRVLRDQPGELIRRIELTPYARAELRIALEQSDDPIEAARRYYVRSWQSFGGSRRGNGGWRYILSSARKKSVTDDWRNIGHLEAIVERLKMVQIENDDALSVMKRYDTPDTLFYCDPPYPHSTRSDKQHLGYRHEMDDGQYRRMGAALNGLTGMVILSGYACDLYDDLFSGWRCVRKKTRALSQDMREECLWMNESVAAKVKQKNLFEEV